MILEQWNPVTIVWDAQVALPENNASLVEPDISTIKKVTTATGSIARLIPQTKTVPDSIEFIFKYQTTLKARIKTYMDNAAYLRITMHTGDKFLGYFIRQNSTWRVFKGTEQKYILAVTFDVVSKE